MKIVSKLLSDFNITPGSAKVPDHSVLMTRLNLSQYECMSREPAADENHINGDYTGNPRSSEVFRKYDVTNVQQDLFSSDECQLQLNNLVTKLENTQNVESEIDGLYNELLSVVHSEMDAKLLYKDVNAGAKRRKRHFYKPWWSRELKDLWEAARLCENEYLQCKGSTSEKQLLRSKYASSRKQFDKKNYVNLSVNITPSKDKEFVTCVLKTPRNSGPK